jgi:hypothetical protein
MHPMHASDHCTAQSSEVPVPEIYISMKQNGCDCGSRVFGYGLRKPSCPTARSLTLMGSVEVRERRRRPSEMCYE